MRDMGRSSLRDVVSGIVLQQEISAVKMEYHNNHQPSFNSSQRVAIIIHLLSLTC